MSHTTSTELQTAGVNPPAKLPNWRALVDRIRADEAAAIEELYGAFSRGIRFYIRRELGPEELEDKVRDTFLLIVRAIRRNELSEPDRLLGFVLTIIRRQIAGYIDQAIRAGH